MTSFYDEVEIEDMEYDPIDEIYSYPCPCGDRFQISLHDLSVGDDIAYCPSCSLIIRFFYIKIEYDVYILFFIHNGFKSYL